MTTIIKPLGKSEDEISAIEKRTGRKWKPSLKKAHVEMYHISKPVDYDIATFERAYGELPTEYKEFLLEFNGGSQTLIF